MVKDKRIHIVIGSFILEMEEKHFFLVSLVFKSFSFSFFTSLFLFIFRFLLYAHFISLSFLVLTLFVSFSMSLSHFLFCRLFPCFNVYYRDKQSLLSAPCSPSAIDSNFSLSLSLSLPLPLSIHLVPGSGTLNQQICNT